LEDLRFKQISLNTFITIATVCTKLQRLCLHNATTITDEALQALAARSPPLHELCLYNCSSLSTVGLSALRGLRSLTLTANHHLTDTEVTAIAQQCPQLQHVELTMCSQLTPACVVALLTRCPRLQSVTLCAGNGGEVVPSDSILGGLARHVCPKLQKLVLGNSLLNPN
jgi:F-box and leucine-rich repeat protein 1 (S-phase kinase-associated protein 2)